MLLQARTKMTAEELATSLEVTPRTIYRDITALNVAGIPIYTERGPGGGIRLLESYQTSLTGMSEDEARALFMLSIPEALVDLGVGEKLRAALLKLAGALPPGQRRMQAHTQQRIYLDSTPWSPQGQPAPHLGIAHQAIWQNKLVRLIYQGGFGTRIEVQIAPLGLVAKMNSWYLLGKDDGYLRVVRVSDILEAEMLDQGFERDEAFDLAAIWKEWCKATRDRRPVYEVLVKASPGLVSKLDIYLREVEKYMVNENGISDDRGWKEVTILYENFFRARESILSLGRAAEVIEPEALKVSVVDFARQIVDYYQPA